MVSDKGLVLTNHHCGYGVIQSHSTVEHDYLSEGFWAMSMEEELPNEGLTARFLVRMEDVTDLVINELNEDMNESERRQKIREVSDSIKEEATENNHYSARVQSFYKGNEFFLFIYETFKDVRLVGAPPSSIGKFGADTDNWMWPRHTGDFSVFRIYADEEGKPAAYKDIRIKYASKYARTANYWKYYIGQTKGLKRLNVYDKKQELENEFMHWVNKDNTRKEKYGEALELIKEGYEQIKPYDLARWYFFEAIYGGSELIRFSRNFHRLEQMLNSGETDEEKLEAMSGDIAFEPELQRTINVDIRYVLFVIDKYAGAKHLIEEMDIVSARAKRIGKSKKTENAVKVEHAEVN